MASPLSLLSQKYSSKWDGAQNVSFRLDGYVIKFNFRNVANLVVAFDHMQFPRPNSDTHPGWGYGFLRANNVSSLHVTPDANCWYRKVSLQSFFKDAANFGLFERFENIMTYGGSMGGFGALSFAGICNANRCLALNPQVHLGPDVRSWEDRFTLALKQDWTDEFCDISKQLQNVETVVVVYDPYYVQDRKQIELLDRVDLIHIRVPFVGHHMPYHLIRMKMAQQIFSDSLSGSIDFAALNLMKRQRRNLDAYKDIVTERLTARGWNKRKIDKILKN